MFTERVVLANGIRLAVAEGPQHGPPLWLFHGVGRRWRDFTPLLPELTPLWTVHAVDHRGHGLSGRAPGHYRVVDYVADAAALVQTGPPAVLVGHSLGALVALGVAVATPDAVRAVVLLDPPGAGYLEHLRTTPYAALWAAMQKLAGPGRTVAEVADILSNLTLPEPGSGKPVRLGAIRDAAALRFMARCLQDLDPAVLTPPLEGCWLDGFGPLPKASITCPALLVVSDLDRGGMLPAADADRLAGAFTDCTRISLNGVGHLPHWQDPATTSRLLLAFLASL